MKHKNLIPSWPNGFQFRKPEGTECSQVLVHNLTDTVQAVDLWGANQGIAAGGFPFVPTGVLPGRMAFNPVNNYTYAIAQISNTVTVFDTGWQVVATIQLEPSFPGLASPSDIVIHPLTGEAFVTGIISDTLYRINTALEVDQTVALAGRPAAIAYAPADGNLYIPCLLSQQVQQVDPATMTVTDTISAGSTPIRCFAHSNGYLYTLNQADASITATDGTGALIATISGLSGTPRDMALEPGTGNIVVLTSQPALDVVDTGTNSVLRTQALAEQGNAIAAIPTTNEWVIATPDGKLLYLASDLTPTVSVDLNGSFSAVLWHPTENAALVADQLAQGVWVLAGAGATAVSFSENYPAINTDFQLNPAIVKHLRVFFSLDTYHPVLLISTKTPTGHQQGHPISLAAHRSPWQFGNMADVYGIEGEIIDGRTRWTLKLQPHQQATLLLYYRQFKRTALLPKNTAA